jgi:TRAP-type C4-dicarboxylate transport system permease small subunit
VRLCLEAVTVTLLLTLAAIVVLAVIYRYSGASFVWYDEVASVMLAWITYYGAALATMRRSHLGFSGFVLSLSRRGRIVLFVLSEAVVYAVFVTMAWAGWVVLEVMAGETLVSLDWVPLQFTQSVVPIGCALFVLAQVLTTPEAWAQALAGRSAEAVEIEQEIKKAQDDLSARPGARR